LRQNLAGAFDVRSRYLRHFRSSSKLLSNTLRISLEAV
jgi:hypothetical protein